MQRTHANKWKTIGHGKLDGREEKTPKRRTNSHERHIAHFLLHGVPLSLSEAARKKKRKEKEVLQCSAVQSIRHTSFQC
jgi:hypothetical protein